MAWMLTLKVSSPFLICDIADVLEARLMGGVVNQDVDSPQVRYRRLDNPTTLGRMLNIARHQNGFPSRRLDLALCCLGVLVLLEIRDQDVGALTGIGDRDRAANAAVPVIMAFLPFRRPE